MTLALLLSACASEAIRGSQDTTPVEEDSFNQHDSQESTQQEVLDVEDEDKGSMDTQTTSPLPQTTSPLPQTTSPLTFTEMTNSSLAENGNSTDVTGEQVPNSDPTKKEHHKNPQSFVSITDSSYSAYGILFLAFVVLPSVPWVIWQLCALCGKITSWGVHGTTFLQVWLFGIFWCCASVCLWWSLTNWPIRGCWEISPAELCLT